MISRPSKLSDTNSNHLSRNTNKLDRKIESAPAAWADTKHDLLSGSSVVLLKSGTTDHENAISHKAELFIGIA